MTLPPRFQVRVSVRTEPHEILDALRGLGL